MKTNTTEKPRDEPRKCLDCEGDLEDGARGNRKRCQACAKAKENARLAARKRERYATDPEWRQMKDERSLAWQREKRATDPEWRQRKYEKTAAWQRNQREMSLYIGIATAQSHIAEHGWNGDPTTDAGQRA